MELGSNDNLFVYVDAHMLPDKPVLIECKQSNLKLKLVVKSVSSDLSGSRVFQ